nr:leucine rich repeat containing protein 6 [Hymenolepis microstoma]
MRAPKNSSRLILNDRCREIQEKAHALERKEALERKLRENNGDTEKLAEEFWHEKSPYTPESRLETYEFLKLQKEQKSGGPSTLEKPKPKRSVFFAENGRPYNINEPKVDFKLYEENTEFGQCFVLDLAAFKNLDTSLIDCDVQTNYIRVTLRNKVFQLALHEEVHPDRSSVQRSRVTGRLLIRMPKVKTSSVIESFSTTKSKRITDLTKQSAEEKGKASNESKSNLLEIGVSKSTVDWRNITNSEYNRDRRDMKAKNPSAVIRKDRENSPSFVDNPNVPPLE